LEPLLSHDRWKFEVGQALLRFAKVFAHLVDEQLVFLLEAMISFLKLNLELH
jgi:hypothetical protein